MMVYKRHSDGKVAGSTPAVQLSRNDPEQVVHTHLRHQAV